MVRLKQSVTVLWSALGLAARALPPVPDSTLVELD
jgi:hypothetical protein